MFIYYNANPVLNIVGDCVIRAISVLTNQPWEIIHEDICYKSRLMYDMPSSNAVWGAFLKELGYVRGDIPDTCPACYTIRDFCKDNPQQKVQELLQNGQMTQEQFNQFSAMADQLTGRRRS